MFRKLANSSAAAKALFRLHPAAIERLYEVAWAARPQLAGPADGSPAHRSELEPSPFVPPLDSGAGAVANLHASTMLWDHLIYAYMIENTRVYEIFARVLREFFGGETLGVPNADSQRWLRTTEQLFYRDPVPSAINAVASPIRPDMRASRRNAYQRMFGMDLNHGGDDSKPYPFARAEAANNEFVSTFEDLLREVWLGTTNFANTVGARPTDDARIANLASKIHEMLRTRRLNGNLSREEFTFVSMMAWFHATVDFDTPIVLDLKAEASSPEQRLFKIAQRVGLPAHGLSHSYFEIADHISAILIQIEAGTYDNQAAVPALYDPSIPPPAVVPGGGHPALSMQVIVNQWSVITGRDIKARKVATT